MALLFSGQSAGIVCTLSGQMVSEGFLNWTVAPALRRALTRVVAITPCLILVLVAGRNGLSGALNASQVVLSLLLPFVSAPLIYFTAHKKIMSVPLSNNCSQQESDSYALQDLSLRDFSFTNNTNNSEDLSAAVEYKDMSNSFLTTALSVIVWVFISGLNFYLLISFTNGKDVHL